MKEKKNRWRFSLSFSSSVPEHRLAAAALAERGRKKSQLVAEALVMYMESMGVDTRALLAEDETEALRRNLDAMKAPVERKPVSGEKRKEKSEPAVKAEPEPERKEQPAQKETPAREPVHQEEKPENRPDDIRQDMSRQAESPAVRVVPPAVNQEPAEKKPASEIRKPANEEVRPVPEPRRPAAEERKQASAPSGRQNAEPDSAALLSALVNMGSAPASPREPAPISGIDQTDLAHIMQDVEMMDDDDSD